MKLSAKQLGRRYERAGRPFWALRHADLSVGAGDFVTVLGRSGSGKTTLLTLLLGLCMPSDLAREIRQPLPAVSRGLRLMEQDGTVVREPDPADRRKTLVRITPKGYELCHQCEQALRNYFASVLARLEPEQVAQMDALRGALMDAILAENAARNIDPKGETNHDKDL